MQSINALRIFLIFFFFALNVKQLPKGKSEIKPTENLVNYID